MANKKMALKALRNAVGDVQTARLEPRHVDLMFLANSHWSPGTRNQRLTSLVQFFKWCRAMKFMPRDSDPAYGWAHLDYSNPEKMRIPHSEWHLLRAACETPHDNAVLGTGLYLFLRGSEQKLLQFKHVHLERDEIEVYRKKVKQWDVMPITQELGSILRPYMTWLGEQGIGNPEHYLIPAKFSPVPTKGIQGFPKAAMPYNPNKPFGKPHENVQAILHRAGYPTWREGEHTLRRSGARAYFDSLLDQGYDGALRRVQSMLGHKEAATTEGYLGLDLDRLKRNQDLKGKPMFPGTNVQIVPLRVVSRGY